MAKLTYNERVKLYQETYSLAKKLASSTHEAHKSAVELREVFAARLIALGVAPK